jgi:hypothetical protein
VIAIGSQESLPGARKGAIIRTFFGKYALRWDASKTQIILEHARTAVPRFGHLQC